MNLRGIHPYSFRSLEWGKVIDISNENRFCYIVEYSDGTTDESPIIDNENYELYEFDLNKFWILSGKEQKLSKENFKTEDLAKIEIMINDKLYDIADYFSIVTGEAALKHFNKDKPVKKNNVS